MQMPEGEDSDSNSSLDIQHAIASKKVNSEAVEVSLESIKQQFPELAESRSKAMTEIQAEVL